LISRRSLLRAGALAAPALIFPRAHATVLNAQGRLQPYRGQIKPSGAPRINWRHPIARGLKMYGFDTGLGYYTSLVPGPPFYAVTNGNVQLENGLSSAALTVPTIQTPWGSGCHWLGASDDFTHRGWMVDVDDTTETNIIQKTNFISGQPAGIGFSFACGAIMMGDPVNNPGLIFGRSFIPDNQNWVWAFTQAIGGTNIECLAISGAGAGGAYTGLQTAASTQIGSTFSASLNQYHSFAASFINNSNTDAFDSSATGLFYADGAQQGSPVTGLNIPSPGFNQSGQLAATETQIQWGQIYHVAAVGSADNAMNGCSFWGGLWNRVLSPSEARVLHLDPYCFLEPAEYELPDMAQAGSAAAFNSGYSFMLGHR
jgi:hypothetical protein